MTCFEDRFTVGIRSNIGYFGEKNESRAKSLIILIFIFPYFNISLGEYWLLNKMNIIWQNGKYTSTSMK